MFSLLSLNFRDSIPFLFKTCLCPCPATSSLWGTGEYFRSCLCGFPTGAAELLTTGDATESCAAPDLPALPTVFSHSPGPHRWWRWSPDQGVNHCAMCRGLIMMSLYMNTSVPVTCFVPRRHTQLQSRKSVPSPHCSVPVLWDPAPERSLVPSVTVSLFLHERGHAESSPPPLAASIFLFKFIISWDSCRRWPRNLVGAWSFFMSTVVSQILLRGCKSFPWRGDLVPAAPASPHVFGQLHLSPWVSPHAKLAVPHVHQLVKFSRKEMAHSCSQFLCEDSTGFCMCLKYW